MLIVLGVVCLGYGCALARAMHRVRSRSRFHMVWLVLGTALAVLGILLHALAPTALEDNAACRMALTAVRAASGMLLALMAAFVLLSCRIMAAARRTPPTELDVIIVLGAQVRRDGLPTKALRFRLEAAQAYLRKHPRTRVVVSGGQGPDEPETEASAMARWLVQHGVNKQRITLEDASTTTAENIAFASQFIDMNREHVGIVTNDFHLYRALRIARRAGVAHAYGISAYSTPWYLPNNLLRECCAVVKNIYAGTM